MMVLLTMVVAIASCNEMPPPSHPATLLAIMLLLMVTVFHRQFVGVRHVNAPAGKKPMSVPLTFCNRIPPPLPLSAALPIIRFALITRPAALKPSGAAPMTTIPPPLVGTVGLALWLKMMVL